MVQNTHLFLSSWEGFLRYTGICRKKTFYLVFIIVAVTEGVC